MKQSAIAPRNKLGTRLMAVAVASSILASTCCVIPLLLVLVGIGGAWMVNLTSLRPVTPVFAVIAVGALLWSGFLVFRPAAACSVEDGAACERARPATKAIFLACAAFIVLLLSFPLIAPYFY